MQRQQPTGDEDEAKRTLTKGMIAKNERERERDPWSCQTHITNRNFVLNPPHEVLLLLFPCFLFLPFSSLDSWLMMWILFVDHATCLVSWFEWRENRNNIKWRNYQSIWEIRGEWSFWYKRCKQNMKDHNHHHIWDCCSLILMMPNVPKDSLILSLNNISWLKPYVMQSVMDNSVSVSDGSLTAVSFSYHLIDSFSIIPKLTNWKSFYKREFLFELRKKTSLWSNFSLFLCQNESWENFLTLMSSITIESWMELTTLRHFNITEMKMKRIKLKKLFRFMHMIKREKE